MPILPIDYQKCVMYKIVCSDINVTEIYVGHTTDFIRRKQQHKSNCSNKNKNSYNSKVYQFIRATGGWNNWSMIEIEKHPCNDSREACKRERYWLETLEATLNSNVPSRTAQEYDIDNSHKIRERKKEYRIQNSNKLKEKEKEYRIQNCNQLKEKNKDYYQANVEIIKAVTICECGGLYQHYHKARHFKSIKHMSYCSQIKS
jgi:hypothetical protein